MIDKQILHPENDTSIDIYPKTSIDQVEGGLSYLPQVLTETQKQQVKNNLDINDTPLPTLDGVVRYDEVQSLNDSQKQQARENIGVNLHTINRNILYNSDFSVGQRGRGSLGIYINTTDTPKYCPDMWFFTRTRLNNNKEFSNTDRNQYGYVEQIIINHEKYLNKYLTLSAKINPLYSNDTMYIQIITNNNVVENSITYPNSNIISVTGFINEETTYIKIRISIMGDCTIDYIKLEEGQTVTDYDKQDYYDNLNDCMKFVQVLNPQTSIALRYSGEEYLPLSLHLIKPLMTYSENYISGFDSPYAYFYDLRTGDDYNLTFVNNNATFNCSIMNNTGNISDTSNDLVKVLFYPNSNMIINTTYVVNQYKKITIDQSPAYVGSTR